MERSCEPMNKNRIEGAAEQGERAKFREALVIKARRRRSGGCAVKECVLIVYARYHSDGDTVENARRGAF